MTIFAPVKVWENKFFDGYVSFESADRTDEWLRQDNRDTGGIQY